jgi:PhnB protein
MTIRLTPYFMTNGNAKEMIQFYEKVLGATVSSTQTYGEMPMPFSDELKDCVAHAIVKVGETDLMFSDSPWKPSHTGDHLTLCISTNSVEKSKYFFEALQQDGNVINPLEETPFSPAFGSVRDKFGVTFTIVTELDK